MSGNKGCWICEGWMHAQCLIFITYQYISNSLVEKEKGVGWEFKVKIYVSFTDKMSYHFSQSTFICQNFSCFTRFFKGLCVQCTSIELKSSSARFSYTIFFIHRLKWKMWQPKKSTHLSVAGGWPRMKMTIPRSGRCRPRDPSSRNH